MSRVSVIITNYNYARYIQQAVRSVLSQAQPFAEIIVVDDGSKDGSRLAIEAQLKEHPFAGILPIYQSNSGQAAAINVGFARCTGEIVCMLDADDVWYAEKVERIVAAFERSPDAAMVMHRYDLIDPQGQIIHASGSGAFPSGDLGSLMVRTGGTWTFGATSSLSFRRSALERILPIPAEKWRLCADGALAYPAAFLGRVIALDDTLGGYRIHGNNNHFAAGVDPDKVQADVEMTNRYLNDFLARVGRPERVDLNRNLHYRRSRFYRKGGDVAEAAAIAKLILTWPLYRGPIERAKFLVRFIARATRGLVGRTPTCASGVAGR